MKSQDVERFVAVVGLPRSGTTVLTALLDAHPRVCLYYEPWNASRKNPPPVPEDLDALLGWLAARFRFAPDPDTRIVGFKETTILPDSTRWAVETVDRIAARCPTSVVWIYRDPILCLLSKIEGARKWWSNPDARFSEEVLVAYLREAGPALRALQALAERHGGWLVQYEALAREPGRLLPVLMTGLGTSFDPDQLEYHRAGPQPHRVMGDVEVARAPAPVTAEREAVRRREADALAPIVGRVLGRPEFGWVCELSARLRARDPISRLGGAA
ncbi:MAG: sulfotransferase [Deltaproteobacteria bacterium]|nr:sulfotransferase [Deltaproteobacteria bacterium]